METSSYHKIVETGWRLRVEWDKYPPNPLEEDNESIVHWFTKHKTHHLFSNTKVDSDFVSSWGDIKRHLEEQYSPEVMLPIYMLDHSGITVKTTPFNNPFDSGQVGYVFIDEEQMRKLSLTKKLAEEFLNAQVEIYDDYLTGNVVYCEIYKDGEEVASCGGFYGDDMMSNGVLEFVEEHTEDSDLALNLIEDLEGVL